MIGVNPSGETNGAGPPAGRFLHTGDISGARLSSLLWGCVLASVLQLVHPAVAAACVCSRAVGPPCSLGPRTVVFVGRVTAVVEDRGAAPFGLRRHTFRVSEAFSGVAAGDRVEVNSDMSSCGIEFAEDGVYLVATSRGSDGTISVELCSSYVSDVDDAHDLIGFLRALRTGNTASRVYGVVIESMTPGPESRSTDPDLYQPVPDVRVTAAATGAYRETTTDGRGRFAFVDLPPGTYRLAVRVRPPKRVLPYSPGFHEFEPDPASVTVGQCPVRVSFSISEWSQLIGDLAPMLQAGPCERAPELTSAPDTTPAAIRFDNARNEPLRVFRLDAEGRRVLRHVLGPGRAAVEEADNAHWWLVTTDDGRCLGTYQAVGKRSIAEVR